MVILSKDNPKIKLYKKLSSSKKYRDDMGLFTIEGMRICVDTALEAVLGNVQIAAFFYTADAFKKYENVLDLSYFEKISQDNKFEISNDIASKMSDEGNSQGVFMIAKKLDKKLDANEINSNGKYLVLDNLQDPGNLGTLLRTADAVGVDGVILTENCVDLYNPKVVRSTMGSMPRLNIYVEKDFSKVTDILHSKKIKTCAAVIKDGKTIPGCDFSNPCAVVIGNEGRGIPDEHVMMCDEKITIKMQGHMDSLNAATAGTIILWEMMRSNGE